jgi:hypothetical protein
MKAVCLAAALLCLTGCATLIDGTHADVPIASEPSGAHYDVLDHQGRVVASGETPGVARLARGRGVFKAGRYELRLAKTGFLPKRTSLATRLSALGWLDWFLVLPASLVDVFTGSCWKLETPPVQHLQPDIPFERSP